MGKKILGLAFIALLAAGCSAGSPKTVAQRFYRALEKDDTKAMTEAATPETMRLMTVLGPIIRAATVKEGKIKTATETVNGDTAVVTITFENGEKTGFDLIKADGKWKVSMNR